MLTKDSYLKMMVDFHVIICDDDCNIVIHWSVLRMFGASAFDTVTPAVFDG